MSGADMSGAGPVADLRAMLRGMAPVRCPGDVVFVAVDEGAGAALMPQALAMVREAEGLSLILPAAVARAAGLEGTAMAQITLTVWSSLEGVGLTAAVAGALAAEGIPANVVAAFHHDHVFVPAPLADRALAVLRRLAEGA